MTLRVAAFAGLLIVPCSGASAQSARVLTGAKVIDVRDGTHTLDTTIVIETGRISAMLSAWIVGEAVLEAAS